MKTITVFLLLAGVLPTCFGLVAQNAEPPARNFAAAGSGHSADPQQIAREYVWGHLGDWGLTPADVEEMTVNDLYTDKTTGITRVYFLQRYRGIPVYNAILNLNIDREGRVFFTGCRFVAHLAAKVNTTSPGISAGEAVAKLASHLGLPAELPQLLRQEDDRRSVFGKAGFAREDVPVTLLFQPTGERVLLAWDVLLSPVGNHDKWSTRVDAVSGSVLHEFNWTVYCRASGRPAGEPVSQDSEKSGIPPAEPFFPDNAAAQYNVWPAPYESPVHGPRTLVANPADPVASPFGWHDTNGQPGPEYTKTRGNNTFAFQDRNDLGYSSNDEPNGGASLHFDFPYDPLWEPEQYVDASVVNLFYWTNYMHDFAYRFGFDEPAGNFQINNYGKGGVGNDGMNAVAQAAANLGISDYPFYRHGNEGSWGTIFMMEATPAYRFLTVQEPAAVAGRYEAGIAGAGWGAGAQIDANPVTGEVVLLDDGVEEPFATDGCEDIKNGAELSGKIAFLDRGGCQLGFKAWQAEQAGAIGVMVCNHNDEYLSQLHPGEFGANVNIPVVLVSASTGQLLRQHIGNGLKVSLVDSGLDLPKKYDSGLDNSVIAHEYGHGISWRLAGGPNLVCLDNSEQMDEGWSDFFALATTVLPGDTGAKKRGWGAYILGESPAGHGSRRYPYSTDMAISPLTYADLAANPEIHDAGEIWCNMIWDMYWALVEKYGWSADPYLESSGNYRAIRLVFEGLKNIPCTPGFVDGRNAILAADSALYAGEDACLLWQVFARRGLGFSAEQGSSFDTGDQTAAFDVPPVCTNRLSVGKSVTGLIQPGDDIVVTLLVSNYKTLTATNVVVTDEIPAGTALVPNSSSLPANVQGNTVSFELGNLASGQEITVTYRLSTPDGAWSQRFFLDDVPDPAGASWIAGGTGASNAWAITSAQPAHSGNFAWYCEEIPGASMQRLELNPDVYAFQVAGSRPALRFYHRYRTQGGVNGGIVEVKTAGSSSWQQTGDYMLRHGYPRTVNMQTFSVNGLPAFSGNGGSDYEATYVDLSEWAGQELQIRFRFSTVGDTASSLGWLIDDIEFLDLLAYNGEACASSDQGDLACAVAPEAGTIVDSRAGPLGAPVQGNDFEARLYPNPASGQMTIALPALLSQDANVSLMALDGKPVLTRAFQGSEVLNVDIRHVPAGLYLVRIDAPEGRFTGKIVIQK